jgi:mono/diheme cytochrome c family protein
MFLLSRGEEKVVSKSNQRSQMIHHSRPAHFAAVLILGSVPFFAASRLRSQEQTSRLPSKTQTTPAGNNEAGKKIYDSQRCVGCHQPDGQGSATIGAPRIAPPPISLQDFVKLVRNPVGTMPPYSTDALSDADLAQVYAYLQSFPEPTQEEKTPPAGNADNGALLFTRDGCYECHGREGQGSRQTSAPRVGPPALPFAEFAKYIRHPRGSMPPYTSRVISESELADVYAFLKSLPSPPPADSLPLLNQ